MGRALKRNVPNGFFTYRKTTKTNKDRLHRALLPYAVGLFVHRKLSGLMGGHMVISRYCQVFFANSTLKK